MLCRCRRGFWHASTADDTVRIRPAFIGFIETCRPSRDLGIRRPCARADDRGRARHRRQGGVAQRARGALPVAVTVAPAETDARRRPGAVRPGLSGGMADPTRRRCRASPSCISMAGSRRRRTTAGQRTSRAPGQNAVSDYPMDQRAALLWYHDHVMGVTRFTVYAGLAGLWIVRDGRERGLGFPKGALRAAAAAPGPKLRQGRAGTAHGRARAQDRPGNDGGIRALHDRQRQDLAAARGHARRRIACG